MQSVQQNSSPCDMTWPSVGHMYLSDFYCLAATDMAVT